MTLTATILPPTPRPQRTSPRRCRTLLLALLLTAASPAGAQSFTFVEAYFDGDVQGAKTIDGLNFVFATAVSADGQNV